MTIQEKVKISSEATKLTLFKEGMFYKCYNEDAMVFTQHVKAYKLSRKFVKSVGVELVSIGFPIAKEAVEVNSMSDIAKQLGASGYESSESFVQFVIGGNLKNDYKNWLQQSANSPIGNNSLLSEPGVTHPSELIRRINDFDLANSTPMQCINFIHLLKQEVKNRGAAYGIIIPLNCTAY